jgi:hypothetical protein
VHALEHPGVLRAAAAAIAEHTDAERIVDDHHGVVALREVAAFAVDALDVLGSLE